MPQTVVLLYPRFEPDFPDPVKRTGPPLAPLTIARPLVREGYEVRIVDENVTPRAIDVLRDCPRPLWVGISALGGNTVNTGRRLAKWVRKLWPGVPIVWGGWNPTLLPHLYEHESAAPWCDAFVQGRGEAQALEITRRLAAGRRDFDGIPGVSWRDDRGVVHKSPRAPFDDPSESEILPYHLIEDLEPYTTKYGMISYISSYGCPHRCEFCGIPAGTQTFKWTRNDRVVSHLKHLVGMGMREVIFFDDNFFTSKRRVLDLARKILDAGLGITWHCNGRVDQVLRFSDEELRLVARSGCKSINIGYETGDQNVADGVTKDYEVGSIYDLAALMARCGVGLSLNFIVGLPGETPESLVESLESLKRIYAIQNDMDVSWYIFMPSPGTPLWAKMVRDGVMPEHDTMDVHGRFDTIFMEHPWYFWGPPRSLWKEWRAKHKAVAWYFWMAYAAPPPSNAVGRWAFGHLRRWCRWRFENRKFRVRADWLLAFYAHRATTLGRWFFKGLSRVRPFWDVYRAFRKVKPAKAPDYLPVAGIPRSI